MDENALRCPQCDSPVLATANYCVICGIRLPDPLVAESEENLGWDAPKPTDDPSQPIPPVDVSDWGIIDPDALAEDDATGEEDVAPTFESIPDLALSDLDEFIASEAAAATDAVTDETDATKVDVVVTEYIEIETMVDEGSPVIPEAEDEDETLDGDQGFPSPAETGVTAPNVAEDAESETGTEDGSNSDDDSSLTELDTPDEAVEPASDASGDEDVPATDASADTSISQAEPLTHVDEAPPTRSPEGQHSETAARADEPLPLISASYPEFEAPTISDSASEGYAQDWSNLDGDPDWIYTQSYATGASDMAHVSQGADPTGSTAKQAVERAQALIDELKSLLPQISQANPVQSHVDRAEIQTLALAARGERSFDDWAALRTVVNASLGRSTDIETILQLSKRVDDVAALLAERDRLQAAFDQLIEATKPIQES